MQTNSTDNDSHWTNPPYPLKPSDAEVKIYKENLITGRTLLLGSTIQLLDICDAALDISPRYNHPKIIKGDWYAITGYYENIIADGSLNLCGTSLIDAVKPHCSVFISRVLCKT